jgi:replicative DNA helicase Mcm
MDNPLETIEKNKLEVEKEKKLENYEKQIEVAKEFFLKIKKDLLNFQQDKVVSIKLDSLKQNRELYQNFIDCPEETLNVLEQGLDLAYPKKKNSRIRFTDIGDDFLIKIDNLRASNLNKLVKLKGYFIQASDVRPQVVNAKFECPSCGTIISVLQIEKKFRPPSKCCCGKEEEIRLISKEMVDTQRVILSNNRETNEEGDPVGARISIFLQEDLIAPYMNIFDRLGDQVEVFGILKEMPVVLGSGEVSTRFDHVIEVNNLHFLKDKNPIIINDKEEKEILSLAKDSRILENLSKSISNSIYGYPELKETLILQLFSEIDNENINTLLIGDPKVGKSNFLREVAKLDIKGDFVDCEIEAKKVNRYFERSMGLDSKNGMIAVDGLDLLDYEEYIAILKYLKYNSGWTSIVASASPTLGRFEPYQTIAQQVSIHPRLINKFDLIFFIRDIPDKEKDEAIAESLLNENNSTNKSTITKEFFQKYLVYAKNKINPKITQEAVKELKSFYVKTRNVKVTEGVTSIPLSSRQLETLKKLAKAHARMRLSKEITKKDTDVAIKLMKYYMNQIGYDSELESFDADRFEGLSSNRRKKIMRVLKTIENLEESLGKFIPQEELENSLTDMDKAELLEYIEMLVAGGDIFIPRKGFIQRI